MIAEYVEASSELYRDVYAIVAPAVQPGFAHTLEFGMPTWNVPLERYPDTYNRQPLQFVALAQQKQYVALYLTFVDEGADATFRRDYAAHGHRLDMGKSCLRLRRPEDVDADLIASVVAATSVDDLLTSYERSRT